jgi:hypothetical protein
LVDGNALIAPKVPVDGPVVIADPGPGMPRDADPDEVDTDEMGTLRGSEPTPGCATVWACTVAIPAISMTAKMCVRCMAPSVGRFAKSSPSVQVPGQRPDRKN